MRFYRFGAALAALAFWADIVGAQPTDEPSLGAGDTPQTAVAQAETSDQTAANITTSIQSSLGAYGDPFGLRSFLQARGIEYSLTYIGEVLGNPKGGVRRGVIPGGRFDLQIDADLEKLFGWRDATFHTNFFQIHGTGLSRSNLINLDVVSGIEALPSTRLFELWIDQGFLDGRFAVRFGQLAADTEFFVSQTASVFMNSTFGWPDYTAVNLPSGGPSYPLATPGVRIKVVPSDEVTLLIGLFNGDPAGTATSFNDPDPQRRNRTGTNFRLNDPPLLQMEGIYAYNFEDAAVASPGTIKLGYFHHFGRFDHLRYDTSGRSLADNSTGGIARRFNGNDGFYGVFDQTIYREAADRDQGASIFLRIAAGPSDRNLVDFYADAGIAYKGLIKGRPDDTFGLGLAYSQISPKAIKLDMDQYSLIGFPKLKRSNETTLEATYQALISPGFTVQPDFQYVFNPGGGIANPRDTHGARIKNAAVFGLRATIRY